ncbi:MAG: GNAT family N-acetyltransferase [Nanoarchaeota archaeon]|nr:GNAT family N-acetyltransferase [Nanoarchaeota archaeon]
MNQEIQNQEYINPSIGEIGKIYFDDRNNRIKFFSTQIHHDADSIDDLVFRGEQLMIEENATRLNARFFTTARYERNVEARISLNNGHIGTDLLYIGVNLSDRSDPEKVMLAERELIESVLSTEPHMRSRLSEGYSIERLTSESLTNQEVDSLVDLYSEAFNTYTTDLNASAVREMISHSVVYGVRDSRNNQIVSTVVAEITKMTLSEENFSICELSEMATRREYRGQGLVTLATKELIEDIRDDVDLIYAEARACHTPINQSFHNMGFHYAGTLLKQCMLSGDHEVDESGPYENLNVWYVLPNEK